MFLPCATEKHSCPASPALLGRPVSRPPHVICLTPALSQWSLYLHFWLGALTGEFVGFDTVQSQDQGINLKEVEFRTTP